MTPQFNFRYDGKSFRELGFRETETDGFRRFSAPDGFYAELHKTGHSDYGLTEWVLWFGNNGERDSGLLSDIRDCAMELPIDADSPRPRQMPCTAVFCQGLLRLRFLCGCGRRLE